MTNLIDIQAKIQKLQTQANEIRSREFDKTVQEILSKMLVFGITLKDLQRASTGKAAEYAGKKTSSSSVFRRQKTKKEPTVVPPKYRGPDAEVWSGRGITPKWLAALVAQGRKKEDFLIKK